MFFKSPNYADELHVARAAFLTELEQQASANAFFASRAPWASGVASLPAEPEPLWGQTLGPTTDPAATLALQSSTPSQATHQPAMPAKSVQALLEDIRLLGEDKHDIVEAVRALVAKSFKASTEEVKYGGILFSAAVQFCGVFAYRDHVSVEFGHGAKISDPLGHLEGTGKGRRHIKLRSLSDIKSKSLAQYLLLAHKAAAEA